MKKAVIVVVIAVVMVGLAAFYWKDHTVGGVLHTFRAKATPRLAMLEKIAAHAATVKKITAIEAAGLQPPPDFGCYGFGKRTPGWNGAVVFAEDLVDFETRVEPPLELVQDDYWYWATALLLRKGLWVNGRPLKYANTARDCFEELMCLRWVLVLRVKVVPPKILDGGRFSPGLAAGAALLYDMDTGSYHGGFPVFAQTDASVGVRVTKRDYDLRSHLGRRFQIALDEAIVKSMPNAVPVKVEKPRKR